ncbi:hypothetical protein [Streptomyces sp. Ag109_O5-10]|uniref:hypothetical protein n=1 Tax=Streptomyces sp. Ag109_O5-10 TaxID=1855349 RepID=UPI000895812E|nr:hypothetical protein [Streptomyces sp. Ag109_O5-10]SED83099.1 hypothetical protein SAMN05216533_0672 [Streptomyces sp. Ag109_O5-10]
MRRLRTLSAENKIAFAGVLISLVGLAVPLVIQLAQAMSRGDELSLQITPVNDVCNDSWMVSDGSRELEPRLQTAADDQLVRWIREGRIVRLDRAVARVTLFGAGDRPVRLQDVSFTVTRRAAPVHGVKMVPPGGCGAGGPEPPGAVAVNLDAIAVGRTVSLDTLKASPRQREARTAALHYGQPLDLPATLPTQDYYTFYVVGLTDRYDCSWRATLTWWDGDKQHRTTVGDHSGDFRVTAEAR